jgi:hypothetical protein
MFSVQRQDKSELTVYNAMVFNVSRKEENELYLDVMRVYGPGQKESLIKPPETYFSSKDACVYILVEWMGERTYNEEFLGEEDQYTRDLKKFRESCSQETEGEEPSWSERSIISLSERLSELVDTTEEGPPEDGDAPTE